MNPFELQDEQFEELNRIYRVYRREGVRCAKAKSYLAACVMTGAALESAIVGMCHLYPEDIKQGSCPRKKNGTIKNILEWHLSELLRVANDCGWLPSQLFPKEEFSRRKALIGDYAHLLREVRNCVHVGAHIRKFSKYRFTKNRTEFYFDVLDAALAHLRPRVEAGLLKAIEEHEGLTQAKGA